MIHIVHVISDLDAGGAEVMLAKLVRGMDGARFSNTVVSLTDEGQLGEQIKSSGVAVHTLGMKRGRPDVSALPKLLRLLKVIRPTIVQSWLYHADLLSTLAVKLAGSPTLIWNVRCSDMDLTRYSALTQWTQKILACCASIPAVVIANSEAGKRQHERLGYRPRRWVLIPNGFDTEQFRPDSCTRLSHRQEWQVPGDAVIIALVARVDPMKDHETFLHAAQLAAQVRRNVYFVLAGKDTERLTSAVVAKGLAARTRLLGYCRRMEGIFPGVDVVCLSSAFGEGFPNVLGEAMACGIPCVATDVGDARGILGETGLVVPARDAVALAGAITDLIDRGPESRAKLGRAARARIEAEYSLPRIVDRYAALYADVQSGKSSAH